MIEQELPSTPEQKDKAIALATSELEKQFGPNTLVRLGARESKLMPSVPTGIFNIDYDVIGVGGFPKARIVEVFGPEASGKTTISLLGVASAQAAGGRAAFIDAEHSLDPNWAQKNGVNTNELLVSQPECGEEALQIADRLVECGGFDIIVIDSVAALVPRSELEGEIGDSNMGVQARLMSQALRILAGKVRRSNCVLLFINQIREKIGVMFGSPETTTGGRALKFYASVRLDVRKAGYIKDGELIVGNKIRVKAAKNKVSAPFRETEVDLVYEEGFDKLASLFDAAVERNVINKSGAWYSYEGDRLGQGREKSLDNLRSMNLYDKLLNQVLEINGII